MKNKSRIHFHTFDFFRFFAFFLVFLLHAPIDNSSFLSFFSNSGGIGVAFFFVLSGFLITYIILFEKKTTEKLQLKNFFVRRVLRIWPLFYVMILFAFLTPYLLNFLSLSSSDEGYEPSLLMSLLFLENYQMMFTGSFPNASPLRVMWSLCVEEHFYIIWGILLYFVSSKKTPIIIGISILIANAVRTVYSYYGISTIDIFSNIDYFAFGAIPAYIILYYSSILDKVEKIPLKFKYSFVFVTVLIVFTKPFINFYWLDIFFPSIFGFLFATLILFTLTPTNFIYVNNKYWISKLGVFTYGLYLYHTIVINLMVQLQKTFSFKLHWFLLSISSLGITILISIISYHIFEKQFLKLKKYFYYIE